ncbi:VWA domain-containing protein [Xinfangfangia sp. D13-10-4-6]|uniref:vWA domain-containing protein n=1 Tax=Pseudogemmobacter hezensis TaxID=2737662 RepID=UPI0015579D69|nr:vWA domain-containing protein [Pseudogemmobacter hezensis]NPD15992.1 VWA domain-containing protein [Pseudogemmobacter hezensis]
MKIVLSALTVFLCTSSIVAAECDAKFEAELRVATEGMKSLEQAKRRLQSRLDGQDFRIGNLSAEQDQTGLPDAPKLPDLALPAAENGEGCTAAPSRQTEAVAAATVVLDQIKEAVATRDKLLTEVEKEGRITSEVPVEVPVAVSDEPAEKKEAEAPVETAAAPEAKADDTPAASADQAETEAAAADDTGAAPAGADSAASDDVGPDDVGPDGGDTVAAANADDASAPEAKDAAEDAAQDPAPAEVAAADPDAAVPSDAPSDTPAEDAEAAQPEAAQPDVAADPADPGTGVDTALADEVPTGPLPLTDPENAEAYIRVISQPGMVLYPEAGATDAGTEVPVFSILYVFERREIGGEPWMQVGRTVRGGPEGWARSDKGVDWTNMLVMQFAPRGKRNQVLFFEEESALNSLVSGPFYQRDAQKLYDSIADERGKADPDWDKRLVAIEPQSAVTYDSKPYLLPILDWRSEMFDGTTDTTLVRVAALPSAPTANIGARDEESFKNDSRVAAGESGEFRVGVVFVIDTTISMRPFIDQTRQAVEQFYEAFSKYDSSNYVSFGLVGFRDNIAGNPDGLEYVTRVFQPLDPEAPASTVLSNIGRVTEATAPTKGFAEDAIAGLTDAIDQNDWSPYNARVIILVTDASARSGDGVKYPDMTLSRLRERARQQGISIVPLHLLTPANAKGDADIARGQYGDLAGTGDIASDKYIAIDATSDEEFSRTVMRLATEVAGSTMVVNSGELLHDEEDEPVPVDYAKPEEKIAAVINNEIFRAQLESLGDIDDGAAPAFLSGWAADRDLTAPETETLEVSAFLTRNQLSTLDKRLEAIIGAFRSGGDNPQTFFANLQKLAAETATDPDNIRAGDSSTIEAILPAFLKNLPYRSQVLRLDQAYWSSMSVAQQQEFIENLEAKRKIYGDIFSQTNNWADFGAGDPGLEATPVRLVHLP